MRTIVGLAVAAAVGIVSTNSNAQVTMAQRCQTSLCIYDKNDTIIGVAGYPGQVYRLIRKEWYTISGVQVDQLTQGQSYYFTAPLCAGQIYLSVGTQVPRSASYDGSKFWFPLGPSEAIAPKSYRWGGTCYATSGAILAAPAASTAPKVFVPNFKMQ